MVVVVVLTLFWLLLVVLWADCCCCCGGHGVRAGEVVFVLEVVLAAAQVLVLGPVAVLLAVVLYFGSRAIMCMRFSGRSFM